ncbi:potassium-transporting ATPase subunit KdpC [Erwinia sp. S38]|uniref:potassium-transporting ATPase subunit KdpC n=1 Tax=Erwinia sp. S38 TaxID=2769338 RepID=UPI00190D4EDE|nr:potassium-transporting ATPase subunit KdpC [Erwinia sp. S38]MBK0004581.1 potassium-transporting ATPase subunit KdpC [Erwinia sp. S38]
MSQCRPALFLLLLLTLVVGVFYPLLTTGLAQWWFPHQAAGSLIELRGEARGSALIGQNFSQPGYFQGRPSATGDAPYNPLASSGSNLAASNPALDQVLEQRAAALRAANPQAVGSIPVDLLTASGSGLDPEISPQAARWQAPRIAAARQLPLGVVQKLIEQQIHTPMPAFIGDPTVNVLALNLALDAM